MIHGTVGDMAKLGVTESFQVKRQVLLSAAEAAEMILRVDNIIKAAPRWFTFLFCSFYLVYYSDKLEFWSNLCGGIHVYLLKIYN